MNGLSQLEPDYSEFVEVDPTGRYGRYNEILGKGSSKTVYRAFDEYEGIEVAWNQVKLYDFLQSPEDLERLYCEIHLLKTLKHTNIMKFYTSWVDTANRNINFVTEMFTSGTLRQYRLKHKRVNIRAVKHWCRQILRGLLYLHSHDPPVIHRDLKCDNIFVNGNQGEVKIGDLGLAAILRKSHAAHCVGTPEFMAPEVYEEEYNELVDIYSFGMCILEMVTFEYPYSECTHPAQIYKKVVSGKKPDALYKVQDQEVRQFVEKCLATVSLRLSARELLKDPFLQIDDCESDLSPIEYQRDFDGRDPILMQQFPEYHHSNSYYGNGYANGVDYEAQNGWDYHHHAVEIESNGIELFEYHEDEHPPHVDISIKGKKRKEDDSIFLRLRIADKEGRIRNIYFPFDIENDTALSVATEMVGELAISDHDVIEIADMIDGEITSLVPEWKPGLGIEETPHYSNFGYCQECASNHTSCGSLMDFLSQNPGANLQAIQCSGHGCGAAMHGRFEEITYQVDGSEHHLTESAPIESSPSEGGSRYYETHESVELSSLGSGESHSYEEHEELDRAISAKDEREIGLMENKSSHENSRNSIKHLSGSRSLNAKDSLAFSLAADSYEEYKELDRAISAKDEREIGLMENKTAHKNSSNSIKHLSGSHSLNAKDLLPFSLAADDYENEIQQELRWLKAKYQIELRELRDQQLELVSNSLNFTWNSSTREQKTINGGLLTSVSNPLQEDNNGILLKSSAIDKHFSSNCHAHHINKSCPNSDTQRARNCKAIKDSSSSPCAENMVTAKSLFTGSLLPHSLHRTTSLPVDAVDI